MRSHPAGELPAAAGIGLRAPHVAEIDARRPPIAWLEVHSENYFVDGGPALASLQRLRRDYPIALHGVGLSLGSTDPLDRAHLAKLQRLTDRIEPSLVSEHLCWSSAGGRCLNDLLPLPYTDEALAHLCSRIDAVQEALGRRIAVENLSSYIAFSNATMSEWEFVAAVAQRTGCWLLVDVNNIYVSAINHGFDAKSYVAAIPPDAVAEIHLAGFEQHDGILIDTHSRPVVAEVWELYRRALQRFGPRPTLIEWDADIPPLERLLDEAATAQAIIDDVASRSSVERVVVERSDDHRTKPPALPSLRDLQCAFVDAVLADEGAASVLSFAATPDAPARMTIYRNAVSAHYRRALLATFPVVARLVGLPFFHAAVDAFVRERPSTNGDLNLYGDAFGDFLQGYPHAANLPYLRDVACLEWMIDESLRATDASESPEAVMAELAAFAAVAPEQLGQLRLRFHPSCRLMVSAYPILRIWQANQADRTDESEISLDEGGDSLLVHRATQRVAIDRIAPSTCAFLIALRDGDDLDTAIDAAEDIDPDFELDAALRVNVARGVVIGIAGNEARATG